MEHGPDKCRVREHFEILRKKTRVVCRITRENVPSRGNWMGRELEIGGEGLESPGMRTRAPELVPRGTEGAGVQAMCKATM